MKTYLDLLENVLSQGEWTDNRTGIPTCSLAGGMFTHQMETGFPLLTTKKVWFSKVKTELEFFIHGLTDKRWLQARKNFIWNQWASPSKAPYGHGSEDKSRMAQESDLGPIYGFQWRHFNGDYASIKSEKNQENYQDKGVDQLKNLVTTLKNDPQSRRMIVSAWNPCQQNKMALPPCHYGFQVTVSSGKRNREAQGAEPSLNLLWNQRSVDLMLGLPFNIASYGLLLHLLAKETGIKEGKLVGFLGDMHIYENHVEGAKEQLTRDPQRYPLPRLETHPFKDLWGWEAGHTLLKGYQSYPAIPLPIAI